MINKLYVLLLSLLLVVFVPAAAQVHTISGYVTDAASSETLIGATVLDLPSGHGCVTNEYGHYSITLPTGEVRLQSGYVGYQSTTTVLHLSSDTVVNLRLPLMGALDEVEIVGNRLELGVKGSQMSAIDIPVEQIKAVPAMFGETDVLKALQLLPGVQNGTEGTAGLYVRGGNPDENLLLLDGVPVYNVNHMFGLFSVFNPDAIKNVTLYKGSFPAHYAGRLSSVVDVRMKDGDMYHWHGNASVGLISSKLNLEGPIVRGKTSLNISARRTYSDVLLNAALLASQFAQKELDLAGAGLGYYFDDLNIKLNHKFSDSDRLYVSWYSGDDDIYFHMKEREEQDYRSQTSFGWKWGNKVATARWNHIVSPQLFMDVSANYTQYRHNMHIALHEEDKSELSEADIKLQLQSGIFDVTARTDFHWSPSAQHEVRFGAAATHHLFRPEVMALTALTIAPVEEGGEPVEEKEEQRYGQGETSSLEVQAYIEDNLSVSDVVKVNAGVNFSLFNVGGRTYFSPEPRMSGRVLLSDNLSVKAGYAYMSQYVHLLSNNSLSLPTDLWVPVTENILPERSHQVALGTFYTIDGICDLSLEGYYKHSNNLLEYKEGVSFMLGSTDWQEKVAMGRGWSYGVEVMAQRSVGRLNGWVAYTWSRTRRLFDREGMVLNGGRPFNAKYDRTHEVDITGNYRFSDRFDLSATWIYATGNCGTVYTQYYLGLPDEYGWSSTIGYAEERNNFRMNPYQRLDLSANFHKMIGRHKQVQRTWNISVYNAYNRMNPFLVYVGEDYDSQSKTWVNKLEQVTLFPIIPTISYGLSW